MLKNMGLPELLLIVAIILLLFGGKKIPEMMRGLGKGMSEFKKASNGEHPADEPPANQPPPPPPVK